MSRSLKKEPGVLPVLLKRVEEMNKTGEKGFLKPGAAHPQSSRISWVTHLPCMTDANTFRFM